MVEYNKKAKAIKTGEMLSGDIFCHKGEEYELCISPGTEEDDWEDFYYIISELGPDHGMDKEFFDEHFEIVR